MEGRLRADAEGVQAPVSSASCIVSRPEEARATLDLRNGNRDGLDLSNMLCGELVAGTTTRDWRSASATNPVTLPP